MPETLTLHALESLAAKEAAATSKTPELDELLNEIGEGLQLTETQVARAESAYGAVTDWLAADDSPVAEFFPRLYSQGSLRLDTTVRPMSHTEFDLDVVCQLDHPSRDPNVIYKLLLDRMQDHGKYKPIVSAEHRCIRLNYTGDFHLDIVPARLDPRKRDGKCILITDRQRKEWWPSNPKGYSEWFEGQVQIVLNMKAAMARDVEPLRSPQPHAERLALRRSVQLLKRWRDVHFKGRMKEAPSSIVLTTLCGKLYDGEQHVASALTDIIDRIVTWSRREDIRFKNPSNDSEWITNRWDSEPKLYDIFVDAMIDLQAKWHAIVDFGEFPAVADDLKKLFDDRPVTEAMVKYARRVANARDAGKLRFDQATKGISIAAPAIAPTPKSIVVPRNTFHGR